MLRGGHAGYLQLPPRLLAVGSTLVPVGDLSLYLALSGTLVGALLAWFLYHVSREWLVSWPVRLALSSLVVLMPALGAENTANITNLIWIFAAVAPWALVSLSDRPRDIVLRSIVAFLAATATSLCFLFLPLAVGFALIRRTTAAIVVCAAFGIGLAVQGAVVLHTKEIVSYIPAAFLDVHRTVRGITDVTGAHVFATLLIGTRSSSTQWFAQHTVLAVAATLVFFALFAVLFVGADRGHQILAVVLTVYALIMFVAPVWNRRDAAPRYSVIPVLLLASALALLVADPTRAPSHWVTRVGRPLFVLQIAVVTILSFSVTTYRSESPTWPKALAMARAQCHGSPPQRRVQVHTDQFNAWPIILSCGDLSA